WLPRRGMGGRGETYQPPILGAAGPPLQTAARKAYIGRMPRRIIMRFALPILAGVALLGLAPARAATEPAAQMAKALEGRTAGDPVRCLNLRDIRSTEIISGTAI